MEPVKFLIKALKNEVKQRKRSGLVSLDGGQVIDLTEIAMCSHISRTEHEGTEYCDTCNHGLPPQFMRRVKRRGWDYPKKIKYLTEEEVDPDGVKSRE